MPLKIVMPQLGESIHEGTLGQWLKKEGEPVKEFEPLLEVTTDKVDTEVTAAGDGILLKIEVPAGTTVPVGAVLGWIGQPEEAASGGNGSGGAAAGAAPASALPRSTDLGFISPVVAKLAAEHKVDLAAIAGTGLGGRITKKDVLAYVDGRASGAPAPAPSVPPTSSLRLPLATPSFRSRPCAAPSPTTCCAASRLRLTSPPFSKPT